MLGKTWKNINNDEAEKIKSYLLDNGGVENAVTSSHENWRVKFSDSTFTHYMKGTLYSTPSKSNDPAVLAAWKHVDSTAGSAYVDPSKPFLIGLDETGKGEVIGHTVLTGVLFPKEIFKKVELLVGPADTKRPHVFDYWDEIFKNLDRLRISGLDFVTEKIPPWHVDKYNLNKIMDVTYQKILSIFFRKAEIGQCRIVVDDYGIGATLSRFLNFLEKQGAEILVTTNSEDKYLEAKTASLLSKRIRQAVMKAINEKSEFQIEDLPIGSGNAGDIKTLDWLKNWYSLGKAWPWFVKRSFKTVRQIENRKEVGKKITPPIREDLLSTSFLDEFEKGRLSILSLSIICPACGGLLKSVNFANFESGGHRISSLKCPNHNCNNLIVNAGFTLRHYCGYVVPDSSAIRRNLISNDLAASRFFEGFTVILCPIVRKECDGTPGGKKEFDQLRAYDAMGRIRLETIGRIEEVPEGLSSAVRDERIVEYCLEYNAILLSADKSMTTFAIGREIFVIFV